MRSPGTVAAQLPPASAARSTITLPGRMESTIGWVTMAGARRPITSAVQMTMSFLATVVGHQLGLLLAERLAHFAGVGAGLAGGFLVLDADEGWRRAT